MTAYLALLSLFFPEKRLTALAFTKVIVDSVRFDTKQGPHSSREARPT